MSVVPEFNNQYLMQFDRRLSWNGVNQAAPFLMKCMSLFMDMFMGSFGRFIYEAIQLNVLSFDPREMAAGH